MNAKTKTNGSLRYLKTFFDEKGLDLEQTFEFTSESGVWHAMSYAVVVEAIYGCGHDEQTQIADTLRRIDFLNGDVKHFFRHLGRGLAAGAR